MKKVFIAGFTGAMGQKAIHLVKEDSAYQLVGVLAPGASNPDPQVYHLSPTTKVYNQLAQVDIKADIWLDFTVPQAVFANTQFALQQHMRPVVGTSGLQTEQIETLQKLAQQQGIGGIIVPNFGLSAVLLMKFAQEAAQYFPDAEIIELHHADKQDAPSGTAISTAQLIADQRQSPEQASASHETLPHVRGGDYQGIKIHSVRLPGYVAHEEVLFGGPGEALTIRQDSFDRQSFMKGVKLALDQVMDLTELVFGLEKIL